MAGGFAALRYRYIGLQCCEARPFPAPLLLWTTVGDLLRCGRPTAVAGLVVAVGVDAVKAHAAAAVAGIVSVSRVKAARLHVAPTFIGASVRQAVRGVAFYTCFSSNAAAAFRPAAAQFLRLRCLRCRSRSDTARSRSNGPWRFRSGCNAKTCQRPNRWPVRSTSRAQPQLVVSPRRKLFPYTMRSLPQSQRQSHLTAPKRDRSGWSASTVQRPNRWPVRSMIKLGIAVSLLRPRGACRS